MSRIRLCDAAVAVLRETDNPAVMWGDEGLLHMIANRAGLKVKNRGWETSLAVLNGLTRTPGELVPRKTMGFGKRSVRMFVLPEKIKDYK